MTSQILTVGVPVYNGAATLQRALDSLASASPERVRIVISDNASTDATESICRRFAEGRTNVTYVRQPVNRGATVNFLVVFEASESPYFMWLASDDWLEDGFLEAAVDVLERNPAHVLVTAASAYYGESAGAYELTTSAGSFEEDSPTARVISYLSQLTDNSEFYGVYRRTALVRLLESFRVIGSDWISMTNTVFTGKVKALPGFTIHRRNRWSRPDRALQVLRDESLPETQAKMPHYVTALFLLHHVAVHSELFAQLGTGERMRLAFQCFSIMRATQQLPKDFDFWRHLRFFFGEAAGTEMGLRIRTRLVELVLAGAEGAAESASLDPATALAIATTLRLRGEPASDDEATLRRRAAPLHDAPRTRLAALAIDAMFGYAWELPALPALSELPLSVWSPFLAYCLEGVEIFADDPDVEAYVDHQARLLALVDDATTLGVTPLPRRIATDRARVLKEFIQGWTAMTTLFSRRNLKPMMALRGRLTRMLLQVSNVATEHAVPKRDRPRRRVGLVVTGLNSLTDTYTALPAISHLDATKFERVIFTMGAGAKEGNPSPMERYAASIADRLIVLRGDFTAMAAQVRAEEIDYLLFGNNICLGFTPLFILANHRLARHQISFNPSCMTSGLPTMDWYVSGRTLEPENAQEQYSEKLLLVDGPGHVRLVPPFEEPLTPPRGGEGRKTGPARYVSGANYYKLTPEVRRTWMQLLARVPGSTLSLYPFGPAWSNRYDTERLLALLERDANREGIDHERLSIHASFPTVADMKLFLSGHDIYLDSFPFSGINSVLDPLSLGIPVVSLRGDSFRSRMGASALDDLGLGALAADDLAGYLDVAARLGNEPAHLGEWRTRLREALRARRAKLWDAAWYSSEFARLFDVMEASGAAR
jgi:glycosyltransferase involved in cell wall biosynthesis